MDLAFARVNSDITFTRYLLWPRFEVVFGNITVLASSSDKCFWLTQDMPLTDICAKLLLSSVEYAVHICIMIVMCKCYSN